MVVQMSSKLNDYLIKVFKEEQTKFTLKGRELGLEEIFSTTALVKDLKAKFPEYDIYLQNENKFSNLRKTFKEDDISIQSLLLQKSNLRKRIRTVIYDIDQHMMHDY